MVKSPAASSLPSPAESACDGSTEVEMVIVMTAQQKSSGVCAIGLARQHQVLWGRLGAAIPFCHMTTRTIGRHIESNRLILSWLHHWEIYLPGKKRFYSDLN